MARSRHRRAWLGPTTKGVRFVPTTQEVFDHHVQGFVARDVPMVLEDYTDTSVVIANGTMCTGLAAIGQLFQDLFVELPKDCAFDLTHCTVLDENVYIMWRAESDAVAYDFATDTFTIKDGKITLQTIGFVKRTK